MEALKSKVLDALSCYMSLSFKHSDTKWDTHTHFRGGGGRAPVAPPLDPPLE